jgi:CheY-like chemotaxis protein
MSKCRAGNAAIGDGPPADRPGPAHGGDCYPWKRHGTGHGDQLPSDRHRGNLVLNQRRMGVGVILLIDDDEPFRRIVTVMLTSAEYRVREASDGAAGLASYREEHADVVLTDILMPEKEGLETIRELRQLDPAVKIIAMSVTGERRFGHLSIALRMGALRSLHKPFTRDELLKTITEVIAE